MGGIGPWQLSILLIIPLGIFLLGFFIGKKSGYIKRVKEEDSKNRGNSNPQKI